MNLFSFEVPLTSAFGSASLKNADRVNLGTCSLQGLAVSIALEAMSIVKPAAVVRRAIGKEDDDLFGIGARRFQLQRSLGMLQAIICPCGTARLNLVDFIFEVSGIAVLAYGKILYDLRVVDAETNLQVSLPTCFPVSSANFTMESWIFLSYP